MEFGRSELASTGPIPQVACPVEMHLAGAELQSRRFAAYARSRAPMHDRVDYLLLSGSDLAVQRSAAAAMARAKELENYVIGSPTKHTKTTARPLLVRQGLRACVRLCLAVPLLPSKKHRHSRHRHRLEATCPENRKVKALKTSVKAHSCLTGQRIRGGLLRKLFADAFALVLASSPFHATLLGLGTARDAVGAWKVGAKVKEDREASCLVHAVRSQGWRGRTCNSHEPSVHMDAWA